MRNPFSRRRGVPFERTPDAEVQDELAFHVEKRIADYVARGMTPEAARRAALARFGDLEAVGGECARLLAEDRRVEYRRDWLDALRQDVRFGFRAAVRAPLFTMLAVTTLALGIGANAAVFGVVKSALLDSLPYRNPERLMRLFQRSLDGTFERGSLAAVTIVDIRERQRSFEELAAFDAFTSEAIYDNDQRPIVIQRSWVEPAVFHVLGTSAARGRLFRDEDTQGDTAMVTILSHAAWQRLFGGARDVVGRTIRINGITREIIGVLPRSFIGPAGGNEADLYFPMSLRPYLRDPISSRRSHNFGMIGRLATGVTFDQANREIAAIGKALATERPLDLGAFGQFATSLRDALVGDTRTPLLFLLASAGLVLLITCANLAGAILSRTLSRRQEFAVRIALGADRGRLVRQLLTESSLLAVAGGVLGLTLASASLTAMRQLAGSVLPAWVDLRLDPGATVIMAVVTFATGIVFGLAPALMVWRARPQTTLREESRGASAGRHAQRLRGLLVAGQIALCVSLLVGATLLSRTLWAIASAPLGFTPDHVLTAQLPLPGGRYDSAAVRVAMFGQLLDRLRAIPGVTGAAITSAIPTRVLSSNGLTIEGRPRAADGSQPFIPYQTVSDDYFRTMGIPLKHGRVFGPGDNANTPGAIIISETMAKTYWPGGNAVGSRIRLGPNLEAPWYTIVGVVGDVRADVARADFGPITYASVRQMPWYPTGLVIRSTGDPMAVARSVEQAVHAVDASIPVFAAQPLETLLDQGLSKRKLPAALLTAFGALALLLASVGVYAMFATMAASREREFGIRVALGSSPGRVAALVLRQGAIWMALGLAGGTVGVVFITRMLGEMVYGVARFDPIALATAFVAFAVCAALAVLGPVRRATRADPIAVMR